jgi:hypothetical protein
VVWQKVKNLTPSVDGEYPLECVKFHGSLLRIDGALGFFKEASAPNNNNKNNNDKISSVWGPVPGPKIK